GIEPDGNQAGDILRVRGSISFEEKDGWQPIGFVAPATALPRASGVGTTAAEQRIAQISSMLQLPGAANPAASRAIVEELDAAHRRIVRRLDRLERALIIAGGPEQGEYHLVAQAMAAQLSASGMATSAIPTQGSLENIGLLERGEADLILVQSDIAAMAYRGQGFFAGQPPRQDMRAIASLFPEALHIVVRQDSPITSVAQLAGKRVDLGLPDSGTRASARAVLAAYGLQETHLQAQPGRNIDEAAQALKNDEIDAFFAVISAPSRRLQALAAEGNMRLLNLHPEAIQTLQATHDSFVALNLAAGTYPGQNRSVATVAVTALLAARADMPAAEVRAAIKALFEETDFLAAGSTAGGLISVHNATKALTLPPHAEALPLLSNTGPHRNRVPGVPLSK
nr:TAXI family TRAP transporter solute-binding subunit [Pseudomonas sp.]